MGVEKIALANGRFVPFSRTNVREIDCVNKRHGKNGCILVVDDEAEMREMICDYLGDVEGYEVRGAVSGEDALNNVLPANDVDLVLSDINMPGMKGFELLNEVRRRYPRVERMLITAYHAEDYFDLAMKYDVGNIFVKTTPFNFGELSTNVTNLLTNDIFGAERYFDPDARVHTLTVKRSDALHEDARKIIDLLPDKSRARKLELVIVELLTNAIFYGVRGEDPDNREAWDHDFELSDSEAITISVLVDKEKYGITVVDNGGNLKKSDVLYWMNQQVTRDENGVPLGLTESHGRGLFIARQYIDRLIVNVDKSKKTEVISINYLSRTYQGYKPLYINEI